MSLCPRPDKHVMKAVTFFSGAIIRNDLAMVHQWRSLAVSGAIDWRSMETDLWFSFRTKFECREEVDRADS